MANGVVHFEIPADDVRASQRLLRECLRLSRQGRMLGSAEGRKSLFEVDGLGEEVAVA